MRDTLAAAAAGAAVGGAAVLLAHRAGWLGQRRRPALALGPGIGVTPAACAAADRPAPSPPPLSSATLTADPVVREQLTRNIQFLGVAGQAALADALVVVVGLGGVGSHAAHLLLRAGVGRLRLVDFDQVTLSSLNRHALATRADVGTPKATSLATALCRIMPEARLEPIVDMFNARTADAVLADAPSYVVDAIDNIHTKVLLLRECGARGLPVVCATGAGAKADPTRVRLLNLDSGAARCADPLARSVRARLRAAGGDPGGVVAVVSDEPARVGLVDPGPTETGDAAAAAAAAAAPPANPEDYRVVPGFRVRTLPVLGPTPAAFGAAAAALVVTDLAAAPILSPSPPPPRTAPHYATLLARLADREERVHGVAPPPVDVDDVAFLVRDVWRGVSAASRDAGTVRFPGGDAGLASATAGLTLTRWDAARGATVDNLVLLTFAEADAHDEGGSVGGDGFRERVEATLARVVAGAV